MYKRYYDILDKKDHDFLFNELIYSNNWQFNGISEVTPDFNIIEPDVNPLWYHPLEHVEYVTEYLFSRIKELIGSNYKLHYVYANGQTRGQDGDWHTDNKAATQVTHTFLYYSNPVWRQEWGGQTLFENDLEKAVAYVPNSGILFDANMRHLGMGPAAGYAGLRTTIAFKLEEEKKE